MEITTQFWMLPFWAKGLIVSFGITAGIVSLVVWYANKKLKECGS